MEDIEDDGARAESRPEEEEEEDAMEVDQQQQQQQAGIVVDDDDDEQEEAASQPTTSHAVVDEDDQIFEDDDDDEAPSSSSPMPPTAATSSAGGSVGGGGGQRSAVVLFDGLFFDLHGGAPPAVSSQEDDDDEQDEQEAATVTLDELQQYYAQPVVDMLSAGGLDAQFALQDWRVRLTRRAAAQGQGGVVVVFDCEYTSDARDVLKSMAAISKHFKVPNTAPGHKMTWRKSSSELAQPRRLSTRVVPQQQPQKASSHKKKKPAAEAPAAAPAVAAAASRAPSSRRNVRTSFLDVGQHAGYYEEDDHHHAASAGAAGEAAALGYHWGADKLGYFPSKPRQAVLNDELNRMHALLDELAVLDVAGLLTNNTQRRMPGGGPCNLFEVRNKLLAMEYCAGGREATVHWDKLAEDVEKIAKLFPPDVVVQSATHVPHLLETLRRTCEASDAELHSTLLAKVRQAEERLFLREKNTEPAMPKWRKELMTTYAYTRLDDYLPAEGLLPEEQAQLLDKLVDTSSSASTNRWVYPDGLEMVDLWAPVLALDRRAASAPHMQDAVSYDSVHEQHTWGIDCFCRRNIQVSLAKLLTVQQTHYFVEHILLRAVNAVRPVDLGWNMRLALHNIISEHPAPVGGGEEQAGLLATSSSTSPQPEPPSSSSTLLQFRRIKIYSTEQDAWRYGRIISLQQEGGGEGEEGEQVLVAFDGEQGAEWHTLRGGGGGEMHELLGDAYYNSGMLQAAVTMPSALVRACCETLLEHIEKKGERLFAVHSKGVGVVTRQPIETGKLIQKYTGYLYPCWLWEQKEAKEDAERLERKRLTNQIVLPDFWNMRLELPAGDLANGTGGGVDLLHVDAKNGGNFSSRMSHSCRPNCGTMTCVVDGRYCIGMRALRPILPGEELTIDYNCVTDSNDEYLAAVCLCGAHDCRGSFLFTTNATKHVQVSSRSHLPLHRVAMLFAACADEPAGELERRYGKTPTETWPLWISPEERQERRKKKKPGGKPQPFQRHRAAAEANTAEGGAGGEQMVSWPVVTAQEEEQEAQLSEYVLQVLARRGLGKRALQMLPNWLLKYAAYLVEFIDCEQFEFARLEFHKTENKSAYSAHDVDERWRIAQLDSVATAEQRVTNLVIALDKARHHMRERLVAGTTGGGDRGRLRDIWWVSDRCLSKWVGDDEDEFPEWYGATVTHVYNNGELRLQYDTHEVNRVPMKLAKRPAVGDIPAPHTGCDVPHHQPPFRVLDEDDVLFFLWTDGDSGVAARLVKCLTELLTQPVQLWQTATVVSTSSSSSSTRGGFSQIKTTYWWNLDTREMRLTRPSPRQLELKTEFVPKVLRQIQRLLLEKTPTTGEGARKCLRELRDLVLRIPIPPSACAIHDNMHQKAADVLTLLSSTKNFFVLREPAADTGSNNSKSGGHAVVNALTSWLGQGVESRAEDITEMIGAALLPCVERAYEHCAGDYRHSVRPVLLDHLRGGSGTGLQRWPKEVRDAFPLASQLPPQPAAMDTQWPHPLPPIRLFGSPSLDAAIYDNLDYARTVALARETTATGGRDLVRFAVAEKDNKCLQHLYSAADQLSKASQRDWGKMDAEDRERVTPPVLPEEIDFTWVQCEQPTCGKWRKLPLGFNERKLPTPFHCTSLAPDIDEERATCEAEQEQDYLLSAQSQQLVELDLRQVRPGEYIDAYDGKEWAVALVLDVKAADELVQVRFLHASALPPVCIDPVIQWRRKQEPGVAFCTLAALHTYTREHDLQFAMNSCVPYDTLYPEVPSDMCALVHDLVRKLEKNELQDRNKKRKAKRQTAKTQITMARQVDTLAKAPLVSNSDHASRTAFYAFWHYEKTRHSPMQPFMSVVAKWNMLDPAQKASWGSSSSSSSGAGGGKRSSSATAASGRVMPPPEPGSEFAGPALSFGAPPLPMRALAEEEENEENEEGEFWGEVEGGALAVGTLVDTGKYGRGVVVQSADEEDSVCVQLAWGKAYFAPSTLTCAFPLFAAARVTERAAGGSGGSKKRSSGNSSSNSSRRKASKTVVENGGGEDEAADKPAKPLSLKKLKLVQPFAHMIEERAVRWRKRWTHMLFPDQ